MLKLGSLFDGAGGFPFAAQICGIEPVWASEIEAFPIAVTTKRFPNMKHLGDVSKINGAEIEPVDIITFGSPCQDLSVAGKRAGLDGERSGLFMQAIRIIKEMRSETNGRYPTIAVWENVPGAFSSAKGEDFRAVLEAFCQVVDENADVPRPANGKWSYAGEIVGDGYSVAWRVLDAQYWGVPQRRRRIFLVADFRGGRAGEILFKREGLSRNFEESRASWQGITKSLAFRTDAEGRAVGEDGCDKRNALCARTYGISSYASNAMKSPNPHSGVYEADTARCLDLNGGNPACNQGGIVIVAIEGNGSRPSHQGNGYSEDGGKGCLVQENVAGALACHNDQFSCYAVGNGQTDQLELHEIPGALNCMHDQQAILVFQAAGDRDNPTISVSDKAFCIPANAMSDRGQAVLCIAPACGEVVNLNKDDIQSKAIIDPRGIAPALYAGECRGGGGEIYTLYLLKNGCVALDRAAYNQGANARFDPGIDDSGRAFTVIAKGPGAVCYAVQRSDEHTESDVASTQSARQFKSATDIVCCYPINTMVATRGGTDDGRTTFGVGEDGEAQFSISAAHSHAVCYAVDCRNGKLQEVNGTLQAKPNGGVSYNLNNVVFIPVEIILRRLTPTECARLQGMPDWWCDDVPHSDSAEYKMWGNGMALPCVLYVMEGVAECLRKEAPNAPD